MKKDDHLHGALKKLDWIAKLSKISCPPGIPDDPQAVAALLNRIVKDVRAVCALLSDLSDRSDLSDTSDKRKSKKHGLIPAHGGYRKLKSFQVSEILYDGTYFFCDRFIDKRSRTHDQMMQAARSGRQNIAEGSMASATSKKTELKLTNVAKASLEELLLDYEDFLRQRRLRQWDKNDPEALDVRHRYKGFPAEWFANVEIIPRSHVPVRKNPSDRSDLSDTSDKSNENDWRKDKADTDRLDPYALIGAPPETAANTLICLANQAIFLLKRQIERLEHDFVEEGGFTERLYRVRTQRRREPQ